MDEKFDSNYTLLLPLLRDTFGPNFHRCIRVEGKEVVFYVQYEDLDYVLQLLRGSSWFQFYALLDMYCVDYPERPNRFEVSYVLVSYRFNYRITVRTAVSDSTLMYSSFTIYSSATWMEREIYDMYGVHFAAHPDLRRLLTDYGFEGFPLRKDFPLSGFTEVRYDDRLKKVVSEPIELSQEYRYFDFLSPWGSPYSGR